MSEVPMYLDEEKEVEADVFAPLPRLISGSGWKH
jgi:hypothetical protein